MLASVIIACYNHAQYLPTCLRSLLSQDFDNIELILIDDSSPDESFAIALQLLSQADYQSRFTNIIIEQNATNLGASATWNRAIARARGDLLFLLNSDDYFAPTRISRFMAEWRARALYFGFSYTTPVDEYGSTLATATAADIKYRPSRLLHKLPTPSWALLDFNISITTGNFVFTQELMERAGGFSALKYCHDWHFALRAATLVEPSVIDQPLYFYRLHRANSFLQLAALADEEAARCYRDYAELALQQRPLNRSCLSPHNQGPAFFTLADLVPPFNRWLSSYSSPYQPHHRTIIPGPYTTGLGPT